MLCDSGQHKFCFDSNHLLHILCNPHIDCKDHVVLCTISLTSSMKYCISMISDGGGGAPPLEALCKFNFGSYSYNVMHYVHRTQIKTHQFYENHFNVLRHSNTDAHMNQCDCTSTVDPQKGCSWNCKLPLAQYKPLSTPPRSVALIGQNSLNLPT